jgi:hypothetical protein
MDEHGYAGNGYDDCELCGHGPAAHLTWPSVTGEHVERIDLYDDRQLRLWEWIKVRVLRRRDPRVVDSVDALTTRHSSKHGDHLEVTWGEDGVLCVHASEPWDQRSGFDAL